MSLWPKEHGAYGQMGVPLATAVAACGWTTPALLTVLAVVASFLAHEPLLVLLGTRGARAKGAQRRGAALWLALTAMLAAGAGLPAVWLAPHEIRWAFGLPLLPAAFLVHGIATGRDKDWPAEVGAATAFSLCAVPVCLSGGARAAAAFSVAVPFALLFGTATLAVRVIVLEVRGGGNPRAVAATRHAAVAVTVVAGIALLAGAARGLAPWTMALASAPGLLAATWLVLAPPPARRLRAVGWTILATSMVTAALLVYAHRGGAH